MHRTVRTIIAILACLLMSAQPGLYGQSAANKQKAIRVLTLNRVQFLYMEDVARFYGFKMAVNGKTITLSSKYSRLVFTNDGRTATINTIDQYLAFSIRTYQGHVLLSLIDFQKVIDPILRPGTIPRHVVRKIVIDPGHGGKALD